MWALVTFIPTVPAFAKYEVRVFENEQLARKYAEKKLKELGLDAGISKDKNLIEEFQGGLELEEQFDLVPVIRVY